VLQGRYGNLFSDIRFLRTTFLFCFKDINCFFQFCLFSFEFFIFGNECSDKFCICTAEQIRLLPTAELLPENDKNSKAANAVEIIDRAFALEREARKANYSPEKLLKMR